MLLKKGSVWEKKSQFSLKSWCYQKKTNHLKMAEKSFILAIQVAGEENNVLPDTNRTQCEYPNIVLSQSLDKNSVKSTFSLINHRVVKIGFMRHFSSE